MARARSRRLTGVDAGFLAMQRVEQPMFNVAFAVLAADGPALTREALREHLRARLDQLPAYRWRVVRVPGDLHRPLAVDDPDFDLDAHVHHVRADAPGADADLDRLVARLAEEPMGLDRPLWRAYLVDGLSGARQAVVLHFHHAIADGSAAMATFRRVFSDEATPDFADQPAYRPGRLPGRAALVLGGVLGLLAAWLRIPGLVVRTVRGVRRLRARRAAGHVVVPAYSRGAPWTVLNEAYTTRRVFVRDTWSLADLRALKSAAGARLGVPVTLNDVVLAVVAGSTRRVLLDAGALPERPLLTVVPMGDEPPGTPERQYGNFFWSLTTTLATDVADPLERLRTIAEVTAEGKAHLQALGPGIVRGWLDVVPPRLVARGAGAVFERLRESSDDVDANILVSNVRGPVEPVTLLGRTVADLHVCGPPSNGVGLNISVMSHGPSLAVSCLAFRDALRDADGFRTALADSLAELRAAAGLADPEHVRTA